MGLIYYYISTELNPNERGLTGSISQDLSDSRLVLCYFLFWFPEED